MRKINIKESLLNMDKETDCKYDLTSLYESCNLTDDKKRKLVKYIDAYDIDATNKFLSNEASSQGLMENTADDISDEELKETLGEDTPQIFEDTNWRTNPSNSKEVRSYVYRKIKPSDKLTDDDSRYWEFDRSISEGDDAVLIRHAQEAPKTAFYQFSLMDDGVDIDVMLDRMGDNDTWYVIDNVPDEDVLTEANNGVVSGILYKVKLDSLNEFLLTEYYNDISEYLEAKAKELLDFQATVWTLSNFTFKDTSNLEYQGVVYSNLEYPDVDAKKVVYIDGESKTILNPAEYQTPPKSHIDDYLIRLVNDCSPFGEGYVVTPGNEMFKFAVKVDLILHLFDTEAEADAFVAEYPKSRSKVSLQECNNSLNEDIISVDAADLENKIRAAATDVVVNKLGYDEGFADKYVVIEVGNTDEEDARVRVEVRADLSYEEAQEVADALNPIVREYDKDAYFDAVTHNTIEAFIRLDQSDDIVDEEAFNYWKGLFDKVTTRDDLINYYKELVHKRDEGSITWGTMDKLFDEVINPLNDRLDAENAPKVEESISKSTSKKLRKEYLLDVFDADEITELAMAYISPRNSKHALSYILKNWDDFYFEDEYSEWLEDNHPEIDTDLDEAAVATMERPMTALKGTLSNVLIQHWNEWATITDTREALAFIDSIEPEVSNKSYIKEVKSKLLNGSVRGRGIERYFTGIIAKGDGHGRDKEGQSKKKYYGEAVKYPNGQECRDDSVDMDKALDYMFGTDRDPDINSYTEDEKQRAVNYWLEKTDSPFNEAVELTICPNCGGERFNDNTGLCVDCGYDEKGHGDLDPRLNETLKEQNDEIAVDYILEDDDIIFDDATGNIMVPSDLIDFTAGHYVNIKFTDDNDKNNIHQYKIATISNDDEYITLEYIDTINELETLYESKSIKESAKISRDEMIDALWYAPYRTKLYGDVDTTFIPTLCKYLNCIADELSFDNFDDFSDAMSKLSDSELMNCYNDYVSHVLSYLDMDNITFLTDDDITLLDGIGVSVGSYNFYDAEDAINTIDNIYFNNRDNKNYRIALSRIIRSCGANGYPVDGEFYEETYWDYERALKLIDVLNYINNKQVNESKSVNENYSTFTKKEFKNKLLDILRNSPKDEYDRNMSFYVAGITIKPTKDKSAYTVTLLPNKDRHGNYTYVPMSDIAHYVIDELTKQDIDCTFRKVGGSGRFTFSIPFELINESTSLDESKSMNEDIDSETIISQVQDFINSDESLVNIINYLFTCDCTPDEVIRLLVDRFDCQEVLVKDTLADDFGIEVGSRYVESKSLICETYDYDYLCDNVKEEEIINFLKTNEKARKKFYKVYDINSDNEWYNEINEYDYYEVIDECKLATTLIKYINQNKAVNDAVFDVVDSLAHDYDNYCKSGYVEMLNDNTISGAYCFRYDIDMEKFLNKLSKNLLKTYGNNQYKDFELEMIFTIDDYDDVDSNAFLYGKLSSLTYKVFHFYDDGNGDYNNPEFIQLYNKYKHIEAYAMNSPEDEDDLNESKSLKEENDMLSANELADKVFTALNKCNISGYGNYIDNANDSVQLYPSDKDISEEITDCLESDFVFEVNRYGHIIVTDLKSLLESKSLKEYYEFIDRKSVEDSDGFMTDYSMYHDVANDKYVFVFGDSDIYSPEDGDFDWECETEEEARQWFNSYDGFADENDDDSWVVDEDFSKDDLEKAKKDPKVKDYIIKTLNGQEVDEPESIKNPEEVNIKGKILDEENEPEKYTIIQDDEQEMVNFIGETQVPYSTYEEAVANLKTDFPMSSFVEEIREYLRENDLYFETYIEGDTLKIHVDNGDWKHDHHYLDYIVTDFFGDKGLTLDTTVDTTESDGSDCYSATHSYEIKGCMLTSLPKDMLDEGLFTDIKNVGKQMWNTAKETNIGQQVGSVVNLGKGIVQGSKTFQDMKKMGSAFKDAVKQTDTFKDIKSKWKSGISKEEIIATMSKCDKEEDVVGVHTAILKSIADGKLTNKNDVDLLVKNLNKKVKKLGLETQYDTNNIMKDANILKQKMEKNKNVSPEDATQLTMDDFMK